MCTIWLPIFFHFPNIDHVKITLKITTQFAGIRTFERKAEMLLIETIILYLFQLAMEHRVYTYTHLVKIESRLITSVDAIS